MINMPKGLQMAIEQADTTSLERHLRAEYEKERDKHQMTSGNFLLQLCHAFKSISTIEVRNPYAELFAMTEHGSKGIDDTANSQWLDNKMFRWWEIASPEWQTI